MSFVGWFDLDDRSVASVRQMLDDLLEGTDDELGLGAVADVIAERLYPALSTQMNYARFFLFVPYVDLSLAERGVGGSAVRSGARRLQNSIRERVNHNGDLRFRSKDPKRSPSALYWGGLGVLGILKRGDLSEAAYQRTFTVQHGGAFDDDDGSTQSDVDAGQPFDDRLVRLWKRLRSKIFHRGKPVETLRIELLRDEAAYLQDRFMWLDEVRGGTLMGDLIRRRWRKPFAYPWQIPASPSLRPWLVQAERLSVAGMGLAHLYDEQLLRSLKQDESRADAFAAWWKGQRQRVLDWDLDDLLGLVKSRRAAETLPFLRTFQNEVRRATSAGRLLRSSSLIDCLREQERRTRGPKARLQPGSRTLRPPLDRSERLYLYSYRHRVGLRFANEIISARGAA